VVLDEVRYIVYLQSTHMNSALNQMVKQMSYDTLLLALTTLVVSWKTKTEDDELYDQRVLSLNGPDTVQHFHQQVAVLVRFHSGCSWYHHADRLLYKYIRQTACQG
jgi:hypothetical protein